jgi:hypothetical protein
MPSRAELIDALTSAAAEGKSHWTGIQGLPNHRAIRVRCIQQPSARDWCYIGHFGPQLVKDGRECGPSPASAIPHLLSRFQLPSSQDDIDPVPGMSDYMTHHYPAHSCAARR